MPEGRQYRGGEGAAARARGTRGPREEIVIARNGTPRARLVPLEAAKRGVPGHGAGKWKTARDFNAPLPADLLAAFDGRVAWTRMTGI